METRSSKRARTARSEESSAAEAPSSPSPLAMLPAELVMKIACELDHHSYLQLALAWRPFLHGYAQAFDPWNKKRLALKRACVNNPGLFETILALRYDEKDYPRDKHCSCCEYIRSDEELVINAMFCNCPKEHADKNAMIVALYDYMLLDSYRRHSQLPLFSSPVGVTFRRATAIAKLIFDKRRARGIVVGACPLDHPPFTFSIRLTYGHIARQIAGSDVHKVLCHPELPLAELYLERNLTPSPSHGTAVGSPDEETLSIARALAEGRNRLTKITGCRTPFMLDSISRGCSKLKYLHVLMDDEPTTTALVRIIGQTQVPALHTLSLGGSDLSDPARVRTIANAVTTSPTLQKLLARNCELNNESVQHLAKVVRQSSTLRSLELSFNPLINDAGACALAAALCANPSSALTDLDLCATKIGDDGAIALAGALVLNYSVIELNLRSTPVGVAGLVALDKVRAVRPFVSSIDDAKVIALVEAFVLDRNMSWLNLVQMCLGHFGVASKKVGSLSDCPTIAIKLDRDQTFDDDDYYDSDEDEEDEDE